MKNIPNVTICLVGDGSQRERLMAMIKAEKLEKNIQWVQSTHDVYSYLLASTIFLSFSRIEALPISFLEAMKARCIIVAMEYRGIEELIETTKDGIICHSTNQMVRESLQILKDGSKYERIVKQAYTKVSSQYSSQNISTYTDAIFSR